jgi:hypothetical protein
MVRPHGLLASCILATFLCFACGRESRPDGRVLLVGIDGAVRTLLGDRAGAEADLREAFTAPRGYSYGVGTGEVLEWGIGRRWRLLLEGDRLRAAAPSFYRDMCAALRREGGAAAVDAVGAS